MQKLIIAFSAGFFFFLLWVIYLANTGQGHPLFKLGQSIPNGDKVGHFLLFGLLTFLANLSFQYKSFTLKKIKLYKGSVIVLIFVTLEELSQHFVASRTLDIFDYGADLIGISLATLLSWVCAKYFYKPRLGLK